MVRGRPRTIVSMSKRELDADSARQFRHGQDRPVRAGYPLPEAGGRFVCQILPDERDLPALVRRAKGEP